VPWDDHRGRGNVRRLKGLLPAGPERGLSAWGAYDMAGNAKEWCWNAIGDRRYLMGGAWDEARRVVSSERRATVDARGRTPLSLRRRPRWAAGRICVCADPKQIAPWPAQHLP